MTLDKPQNIYEILLPLPFDYGFSYFAANNLKPEIGQIVKVPFRNKEIFGVVIGKEKSSKIDSKKIKNISNLEDIKLDAKLLEFIDWTANYNLAPKGLVLKLAIAILNSSKKPKRKRKEQLKKQININLKPLLKNQQKAADFLAKKIAEDKFSTTLIDGITGSGKTEIYFQAIAEILQNINQSEQILILLPEITLTSQLCSRFKEQFGFAADLWHSKISNGKKRELFFRILNGDCKILIGARSALFLPFKNLKLIIIDEEHDGSFKQEDIVNYQGRDMAIMRAKIENIPIILSSATPSIESYLNAKNNKYHLLKLEERFGQTEQTEVILLDMKQEKLAKNQFISNPLKEELAKNLQQKKQSLLFLNRRGYAPLTICRNCGSKVSCHNCSSYLTFHQKFNRLICHHCGFGKKMINHCQNCDQKDHLANCGVGAERLKEEILENFPNAKIALMTSDEVKNVNDANNLIEQILDHQIDIIIGTQMIAKGHHFPSLALVGIIDGDGSFLGGNLRTAERSYQLLTQVIGRAGRENFAGKVILQSYNPQNPVFKKIIDGKRDEFLEEEIANREMLELPPFYKIAKIIFSGNNENMVVKTAKLVLAKFPISEKITIFGPAPMPIIRVKNQYHYCLNIKTTKKLNIQKLIKQTLQDCSIPSWVRVKIDIDPN